MKNKIKKTFLDILFEPDDDEEEIFPEKEDETNLKQVEEDLKNDSTNKEDGQLNARDVLYRKSGKSAFINLDETMEQEIQSVSTKQEIKNDEYEFSSQLSPIFGVVGTNDNNKKTVKKVDPEVSEHLINKPENSHLEIITSPIYGYGSKEDIEKGNDNQMIDEEELHELLDDNDDSAVHDDFSDHVYVEYNDPDTDEINLFNSYGDDE